MAARQDVLDKIDAVLDANTALVEAYPSFGEWTAEAVSALERMRVEEVQRGAVFEQQKEKIL